MKTPERPSDHRAEKDRTDTQEPGHSEVPDQAASAGTPNAAAQRHADAQKVASMLSLKEGETVQDQILDYFGTGEGSKAEALVEAHGVTREQMEPLVLTGLVDDARKGWDGEIGRIIQSFKPSVELLHDPELQEAACSAAAVLLRDGEFERAMNVLSRLDVPREDVISVLAKRLVHELEFGMLSSARMYKTTFPALWPDLIHKPYIKMAAKRCAEQLRAEDVEELSREARKLFEL